MELNVEETKKALQCCILRECSDCSFSGYGCLVGLPKSALAVIDLYEKRIEELTKERDDWIAIADNYRRYKRLYKKKWDELKTKYTEDEK